MDLENKPGQTVLVTRVIGKITEPLAKESSFILTAMYTKVIG